MIIYSAVVTPLWQNSTSLYHCKKKLILADSYIYFVELTFKGLSMDKFANFSYSQHWKIIYSNGVITCSKTEIKPVMQS